MNSAGRTSRAPGLIALAAVVALVVAVSGCSGGGEKPTLQVSATTLLQGPLNTIAARYTAATVKPTYATDADLAAKVRAGKGGDLIVSTDLAALTALSKAGLVQPPAVFGSDKVIVAYHRIDGRARFPSLATLTAAHLRLETPSAGTDFAAAAAAALAALPPAQRAALQSDVTDHAASSRTILADVVSGKAAAGLVLKSQLESLVNRPASEWSGLGGWLEFGPPISYNAAVVNPARGHHADAARAQAVAAFVYQLLDEDETPSHILQDNQIGAPASTRPYEPPPYTPTGNLYPTTRPTTKPAGPAPTYHFTPPSSPTATP